jgi:prepilin-type N-terminal cleavage/methylation domain-containing protein
MDDRRKKGRITQYACCLKNRCGGFTLVEVMVAVSITAVVALGTLCYQYHGVKHSRISQAQVTATRLGQLLLEDWKSTGGDPDYDPVSLGLGFASPVPSNPGHFLITLDNQTFYIQLVRSEIDRDDVASVILYQIQLIVRWRTDYAAGSLGGDDPTITLTTYVRRDG